jgi:hypothetical protein
MFHILFNSSLTSSSSPPSLTSHSIISYQVYMTNEVENVVKQARKQSKVSMLPASATDALQLFCRSSHEIKFCAWKRLHVDMC